MMINPKYKLLCAALFGAACLSGCKETSKEEQQLADFSASMSDFTSYIKDIDEKINRLDVNNKESVSELLEILDGMNAEFAKLAALEVPEQYKGVEALADQASEFMSLAASYYHTAYEGEPFSRNDADVAYQYYGRVMVRVEYIGYVLSGEIPENDHVTIHEELMDSNILDKWLPGDEDGPGSEN